MQVKELIAELQKYDGEMQVLIQAGIGYEKVYELYVQNEIHDNFNKDVQPFSALIIS
jgi:hypothetical protein